MKNLTTPQAIRQSQYSGLQNWRNFQPDKQQAKKYAPKKLVQTTKF